MTLLLVALEDNVSDRIQAEAVEDKPLGRLSPIGDVSGQLVPNALYVAGMYLHSRISGDATSLERAKLMFEASSYAVTVSGVLKYTIREPRPNNSRDRTSFPSGHATSAFAFASVVGAEHAWTWGVPAYLLAGLVAFSRINDNRHELHDVVAGAVLGASYGLGFHYLARPAAEAQHFYILPLEDHHGFATSWRMEF